MILILILLLSQIANSNEIVPHHRLMSLKYRSITRELKYLSFSEIVKLTEDSLKTQIAHKNKLFNKIKTAKILNNPELKSCYLFFCEDWMRLLCKYDKVNHFTFDIIANHLGMSNYKIIKKKFLVESYYARETCDMY